MSDRLKPLDMAFLAGESSHVPMHVGTLDVFEPGEAGLDLDRLTDLISDRIAFVPRYRQRVQWVPGRLANPMWVDDDQFDLSFHVRRSALPRPGTPQQLRELAGRLMGRRLDRDRPLWEVYLVEGLAGDRYAVLTKSHQALVDGATLEIGQVIFDATDDVPVVPEDDWEPARRRGAVELLAGAALDVVRDPTRAWENIEGQIVTLGHLRSRARSMATSAMGRSTPATSPLAVPLSKQRRFETLETSLDDYRLVRDEHGGTVNDAVLATITGGLRAWMLTRAEPLPTGTTLRAMVPLSVIDDDDAEPTSLGTQVKANHVALPIGEGSPVVRLHQVSYALKAHKETGHAVAASKLTDFSGFAPTTFHALGARVAAGESPRAYDVLITNVPGPQHDIYAAGARLAESYPVLPLVRGHALAIGVTSYDGRVFFGVHADRDAVPDVDVLVQCLEEALDELVDASAPTRAKVPRGKVRPSTPRTPAARRASGSRARRRTLPSRRQESQ